MGGMAPPFQVMSNEWTKEPVEARCVEAPRDVLGERAAGVAANRAGVRAKGSVVLDEHVTAVGLRGFGELFDNVVVRRRDM